jgi:hypothetical protein
MNPSHINREGKPAPGPRRWVRKVNATPVPSMKPDFRAIVAAAEKAGQIHRSKP